MLIDGKSKKEVVGTPDYMAPEMIKATSNLSPSIDWWAIGCIIYEFIIGIPPFNDKTVEQVWDNAINRRITWPEVGYGDDMITPEAKDLIEQLLQPDPDLRLTDIEKFKQHPFFKDFDFANVFSADPPLVPKLNQLNYDKSITVPLTDIFEPTDTLPSNNKMVPKLKRKNIETVRHDVLHEENLNFVVDSA